MKPIVLVNGYSFSLEDVVIVEELKEINIKGEISRQFSIHLNGGYSLFISQEIKNDITKQNVIDILYNAIYQRRIRIDTINGPIDISSLDTSLLYVHFKKP